MWHTVETKIKSLDEQLKRAVYKAWYEEDEKSPDELLDLRLELMAQRGTK